jgi:hypothetical protein
MQASATRVESRAQAISWLVSQLRWEQTLGALRHGSYDDVRHDAARAA